MFIIQSERIKIKAVKKKLPIIELSCNGTATNMNSTKK
jgi:hypothetical protein